MPDAAAEPLSHVPPPGAALTPQQLAEHPVVKLAVRAFAERKPRGDPR